ncbi:MAG: hypothetical protein V9G19_04035 [Tetrasphaera sp.]
MIDGRGLDAEVSRQPTHRERLQPVLVGALCTVALIADIALAGAGTVPTTAAEWLAQLRSRPPLGLRNLDLLNASLAVVRLPRYAAIYGAHRLVDPALTGLGVLLVAVGAALFLASNVALPMLDLATRCPRDCTAAAEALLARGAHGSLGALPGFLVSETGTLIVAWTMLHGHVFGRLTAWTGMRGAGGLMLFTAAATAAGGTTGPLLLLALPAESSPRAGSR